MEDNKSTVEREFQLKYPLHVAKFGCRNPKCEFKGVKGPKGTIYSNGKIPPDAVWVCCKACGWTHKYCGSHPNSAKGMCGGEPEKGKDRCKLHGRGGRPYEGKGPSKFLPDWLSDDFEVLKVSRDLLELREEIAACKATYRYHYRELAQGRAPGAIIDDARRLMAIIKKGGSAGVAAVRELDKLLNGEGKIMAEHYKQIGEWIDRTERLTSSDTKREALLERNVSRSELQATKIALIRSVEEVAEHLQRLYPGVPGVRGLIDANFAKYTSRGNPGSAPEPLGLGD